MILYKIQKSFINCLHYQVAFQQDKNYVRMTCSYKTLMVPFLPGGPAVVVNETVVVGCSTVVGGGTVDDGVGGITVEEGEDVCFTVVSDTVLEETAGVVDGA